MRSAARKGLLMIFCLALVGIVTAFVAGGMWLLIQAPQVVVLGGALVVVCAMLAALAGSIRSRSDES